MALAVESQWPASAPLDGLVITRYRHGLLTNRIKVVEAGHPVPDESGEAAARETLRLARSLGPDDLLLALVSGGGSSLLTLPADGLGMTDLKATNRELLRCGAPIQDMNTVRKHLSAIHGGRLAGATRAKVIALIVSDVTGDDPTHIGSGPCAPDPTTYADALEIVDRYGVVAPPAVRAHLERGARGEIAETPKPGDRLFDRVDNRIVGTAQSSLQAAARCFESAGIPAAVLGDSVTGEASEVAKVYGALVRQVQQHGQPFKPPVALVSGGECTVTVRGAGRGGRCSEFLLALAIDLAAAPGVHAIAADTDGIDGSEDNAGALLAPDTLARARAAGLNPRQLAAGNDAYGFFAGIDDLVVTGPTRTNVNDYRAILIL
jgi:hydroxypyruvate reductase